MISAPFEFSMGRTLVVAPAYNEAENIVALVREVMAVPGIAGMIVVDDNSPDGTGQLVRELQAELHGVHLLQPDRRLGRGGSAIAGLIRALELEADRIIEMDADFSHSPSSIPALLQASSCYPLVIGSRLVPGGDDRQRPLLRRLVTRLACAAVRLLLGMPVRDPTSGFRCYHRDVLEKVKLSELLSTGPSELIEILHRALLAGFVAGEIPIEFIDRRKGRSKLHVFLLLDTLRMVVRFRWRYGKKGT
jgi:dolichol-phosphate mannosyltransferase